MLVNVNGQSAYRYHPQTMLVNRQGGQVYVQPQQNMVMTPQGSMILQPGMVQPSTTDTPSEMTTETPLVRRLD